MKRLFLFLIYIFFICISKAEINTNILGLNIGISSKQNVETMFKQRGLRYEYINSQYILGVGKINFAGLEFKAISCSFYNDQLSSLTLMGEDESQFRNLYYSLKIKYAEYTPKFDEESGFITWGDGYNEVNLYLDTESPEKNFYISYTNRDLMTKTIEQNNSEL